MLMLVLMNEIFFFLKKKMQHKKTEKLNECVCCLETFLVGENGLM